MHSELLMSSYIFLIGLILVSIGTGWLILMRVESQLKRIADALEKK